MRIISFIESYNARGAVDTIEIEREKEERIIQLPTVFPNAASEVRELTRATLNVLAEDLENKQIEKHQTKPIWLLARNSAPLAVRNPSNYSWTALSY